MPLQRLPPGSQGCVLLYRVSHARQIVKGERKGFSSQNSKGEGPSSFQKVKTLHKKIQNKATRK